MSLSIRALIGKRRALQEVLKEYERSNNVILIAPTGYGKTILSLELISRTKSLGLSSGLIHVVPYRALVRQIYEEKFKGNFMSVGYQALDEVAAEDKSPYYLRELIVTTLDSFIYNLYKLPVAEMYKIISGERSLGHYYPVLASILTSTIVFDEAHVYLGRELAEGNGGEAEPLAFMFAALNFLLQMNTPIVIESATMHSEVIAKIFQQFADDRKVIVIYVGDENLQVRNLREKGVRVSVVRDNEFEEVHGFPWITRLNTPDEVLKHVEEVCESEPVLVIRNTVKFAIETYEYLSRKCNKVALIHGLLSNKGRDRALNEIREISERKGVIISTQVIEAGVDVGTRILVTEPAPIENLAQRAGRLCRDKFASIFKECQELGAEIHIIKEDPSRFSEVYNVSRVQETIEKLKKLVESDERALNWRLLAASRGGIRSFSEILEEVSVEIPHEVLSNFAYRFAGAYLHSDAQPDALIKVLEDYGAGLVRSGVLVNVVIPPYNDKHFEEFEVITVDLERLLKRESLIRTKCLDYVVERDEIYPKLLAIGYDKDGKLQYIETKLRNSLKSIVKALEKGHSFTYILHLLSNVQGVEERDVIGLIRSFLIARRECFDPIKGFKIW